MTFNIQSECFISAQPAQLLSNLFMTLAPVGDVIKLFWRKSRISRFPPQLKQQIQAIFKAITCVTVQFCLEIAKFLHFCAHIRAKLSNINYRSRSFIIGNRQKIKRYETVSLWQFSCCMICFRLYVEFPSRTVDLRRLKGLNQNRSKEKECKGEGEIV